jgi:hypothetical protein
MIEGPLLPQQTHVPDVNADTAVDTASKVLSTRDHQVIRQWAARRQAEPATGEATASGPATIDVKDGGAGIRFNFPGRGAYRPIAWDEWFQNFDAHGCAFVFDHDEPSTAPSSRYRIVKAADWKETIG